MIHQNNIDKGHWLEKNERIVFTAIKKAFFGKYLYKIKLKIPGISIRFYGINESELINYIDFYNIIIDRLTKNKFNNIIKQDDRYVTIKRNSFFRDRKAQKTEILDIQLLHRVYLIDTKNIRYSRNHYDKLIIYSRTVRELEDILIYLKTPNTIIREIAYPNDADMPNLLNGIELTHHAKKFNYKVTFKQTDIKSGMPEVYNYLIQMEKVGECFMPLYSKKLMNKDLPTLKWQWSNDGGRPMVYIKDYSMLVIIQLLAGDRFSTITEIALPSSDK